MEEKTNFQNLINNCLISLKTKKLNQYNKLTTIRTDILLNSVPKNYSNDSNFRLNLASKKTSELLNEIENIYSQNINNKNIFKKDPKTKDEINNFYNTLKINNATTTLKKCSSQNNIINNDTSRYKNCRSNSSLMLNSNNYGNNFYNFKNNRKNNLSNYSLNYRENKIKNALKKFKNNTLYNDSNNKLLNSQNNIDTNDYDKTLYKSNSNLNLFKTQLGLFLKKDFRKNYLFENNNNKQNNNNALSINELFDKLKKNIVNQKSENRTTSNFLNYNNNNNLKNFNFKKINSKSISENNRDFENFKVKLTERENFNQRLLNFKKKLDLLGTH